MRNLIERINRTVNEGFASPMRIAVSKGMLDFIWHPLDGELEVGLGGEWWNGKLPLRDGEVAQFHHRKEGVDPAYRPVHVRWERQGHGILFHLAGGFLSDEATVLVGASKVVSEGRNEK
jgi:hypothetical protein